MNKIMLSLSSIFSGLEYSTVNNTSINENFKVNVFESMDSFVEILTINQMIYFEQMYTGLLNHVDNSC